MGKFLKKQVRTLYLRKTRLSSNLSFFKNFAGFSVKNKGIVILLPTIILSGLILVVGLGLSQVLITELEFSADLLFSEKAYFAAESGVEKSLLALRGRPLNYVVEQGVKVGNGATYDLNIANQVKQFDFDLDQNESVKFRLGYDDSPDFAGYSLKPITNFKIPDEGFAGTRADLHWRILCLKNREGENPAKTIALFGTGTDFVNGNYDDGGNISLQDDGVTLNYAPMSVSNFLSSNNNSDNICFMSLTNFGTGKIRGIFQPIAPTIIAPAKVNVTATGKSFSREKIVSFDYWQKNLSAVYDLGLFYTGE